MKNLIFLIALTFYSFAFAGCNAEYLENPNGSYPTYYGMNYQIGQGYITIEPSNNADNDANRCMIDRNGDLFWDQLSDTQQGGLLDNPSCKVNSGYTMIAVALCTGYNGNQPVFTQIMAVCQRSFIDQLQLSNPSQTNPMEVALLKSAFNIGYRNGNYNPNQPCSSGPMYGTAATQYEILN